MGKLALFSEIWRFLIVRKQWWLLPLIVMIVVAAFLLVFAQTSPLGPFIYTLI